MTREKQTPSDFCTTWPVFQELKTVHAANWQPVTQIKDEDIVSDVSALRRRQYVSKKKGEPTVDYTHTTFTLFKTDTVSVSKFKRMAQQGAKMELNCFRYAPHVGLHVPAQFSQVTRFSTDATQIEINAVACHETWLATAKPEGKDLIKLLNSRKIAKSKQQAIRDEAMTQGMIRLIAFDDPDSFMGKDVVVQDLNEEKPKNFIYSSFNGVRLGISADNLQSALVENTTQLAVFCHDDEEEDDASQKRFTTLCTRLSEARDGLTKNASVIDGEDLKAMITQFNRGIDVVKSVGGLFGLTS